jgi:hypothetical protein
MGNIRSEFTFTGPGTCIIRGVHVVDGPETHETVLVTYDGAPTTRLDTTSGSILTEYATPEIAGGDSFMYSLSSTYAEYVYCMSRKGKVFCFDLSAGKLLNVIPVFEGEFKAAVHHPTSAIMVVASSHGTVYILGN